MKKILSLTSTLALLIAASLTAAAADKTITGEGCCAKCALKQTSSCQNAIAVKDGDKTVLYLLEGNDVSKAFHKNLCSSTAKVTATGTTKDVDGKHIFTASKIELAK